MMFPSIFKQIPTIKVAVITLLMTFVTSLSAAALDEERAQLASLKAKVQELTAVNNDIELNIADLTKQLAAVVPDNEASEALEEAEAAVLAADQAKTVDPSAENLAKWENSEFKLKLAQRKFDKANQEPARLGKERTDLTAALASNQRQISYLNSRITDQQELIDRLSQEHQAATDTSLAAQQQQLKQEQQEREQAQQEIAQLKALLAEKEAAEAAALLEQETAAIATAEAAEQLERERIVQQQIDDAETTADTPKPPPPATDEAAESGVILLTNASQVSAEVTRLNAQINKDGAVSKVNKILHMKSYRRSRLLKRSSHSMKSLSTTQYQSEVEMRKGTTEFVVGSASWTLEVPDEEDNKAYIVTLDLSNPEQERLLMYPASLAN